MKYVPYILGLVAIAAAFAILSTHPDGEALRTSIDKNAFGGFTYSVLASIGLTIGLRLFSRIKRSR